MPDVLPQIRGWHVCPAVRSVTSCSRVLRDAPRGTAVQQRLSRFLARSATVPNASRGTLGWRRCALVGSSGALIGARLGARIDAHDAVLRFNGAPTTPYEADVGRRTTVSVGKHQVVVRQARAAPDALLFAAKDETLKNWAGVPRRQAVLPSHRAARRCRRRRVPALGWCGLRT